MEVPLPPRRSLTRRDFVKGAAALGLGGAMIVPSRVLGDAPAATAPSDRISLGFIGIGKQASGHLDALSGMGSTQVVAVCDVHTLRRNRAKETVDKKYALLERAGYAGCDTHKDYRELLDRKDIDAVVIGVPDHWHAAIAIEACKAGKDIYCEKPLTLTIHEARTLIDAVRKHDRIFQTGSQQRSQGPFRQACDYIRNGRLGKISEVHVGVGATSKWCDLGAEDPDPGLNWEVWLGQAPMRPYNHIICQRGLPDTYPFNPGWRDYREYSGGYVTDWGAHHFDITQWALDMDHSGPVEARPPANPDSKYGAQVVYRGSPVGDEIVVTHVQHVYEYDTLEAPKRSKTSATQPATQPTTQLAKPRHVTEDNGILFIGEKGKLFVNRESIISDPKSILLEPLGPSDQRLFVSPGQRENWLHCIRSRNLPICDVEIGARSVTVCHLINLAYWHGRVMKWDPQAWEFPGDAEANGWRTRERRKGYELPEI
jgi:predicted dehydrogenase